MYIEKNFFINERMLNNVKKNICFVCLVEQLLYVDLFDG